MYLRHDSSSDLSEQSSLPSQMADFGIHCPFPQVACCGPHIMNGGCVTSKNKNNNTIFTTAQLLCTTSICYRPKYQK